MQNLKQNQTSEKIKKIKKNKNKNNLFHYQIYPSYSVQCIPLSPDTLFNLYVTIYSLICFFLARKNYIFTLFPYKDIFLGHVGLGRCISCQLQMDITEKEKMNFSFWFVVITLFQACLNFPSVIRWTLRYTKISNGDTIS